MIERKQYRACLKAGWKQEQLEETAKAAAGTAREAVEAGDILTASLYRYHDMCFLYYEALKENIVPTDFLAPLTPLLEEWPEENGKTPWAYMYHIFHHSVPEDISEWTRERTEGKKRIGRIAFLWPDRVFSYVRWHQAIVEEGLLKGDKYQCISLHENILFSYFEEPRFNVNVRKEPERESEVIKGWMAADPESHFDRVKAGGDNFLIIDRIFSVG